MKEETQERNLYANLSTDFMFKRIFGSEDSKDILIAFLNRVVGNGRITDLTFLNTEHLGDTPEDRRSVFDICVRTADGEEYIIEMQFQWQTYFKDRALFYTAYPIRTQFRLAKEEFRKRAEAEGRTPGRFIWNYRLKPVKLIAILNHAMEHTGKWSDDEYQASYILREKKTGEVMSENLEFIFFDLTRFRKTEAELVNATDKWLYLLKNMKSPDRRKGVFEDKEFDHLFEMAELCNFTPEELSIYQNSQINMFDYQNAIDSAAERGEKKGREEGRDEKALEVAKKLIAKGMPLDEIVQVCSLSEEQVKELMM